MKTRLLVVLMALMPFVLQAQELGTGKETSAIEVVGTGEMEVVPNEIFLSFTLKERFDGKTKIDIEKQEKELKKNLVKIGIDINDLQLADAASDYIKIKRKKSDVIASKDYILKVKTTSEIANVFEMLDEIDAFNANVQRVNHSEIEKFKVEVKMMAVKAAKEKASYLLTAIGEKLGKPILIQEREMYEDFQPLRKTAMMANMVMDTAGDQEEALPEIGFQKIKLKYSVFAKFAIQ